MTKPFGKTGANTAYGFDWEHCTVQRASTRCGYLYLSVITNKQLLQIVISPTGMIRTHKTKSTQEDRDGLREMKT
jgi:hypothetical protein